MDQNTNGDLMIQRAALLERYRQLRTTMRELHSQLLDTLPKDTLTRCGKKYKRCCGRAH